MTRETKTFTAEIKAAPTSGPDAGTFTALVSVFGNVDRGGDRILPGAFTKTLADWAAKGDPIPVIWSHEWDDPFAHIGYVETIAETAQGLEVKGRLDTDRDFAAQVNHLLVTRRVTQFSFGYFPTQTQMVEDPVYGTVRELLEVELFEVGPTLVGMNPATELVEAASATRDRKAGRVLSGKNEAKIRAAYDALGEVLTTLGTDTQKSVEPTVSANVTTGSGGIYSSASYATYTISGNVKTIDPETKAAPEIKVGTFVEWDTVSSTSRGKVEDVITDGVYQVPESDFTVEASSADPALVIRVYRPVRDGFAAGDALVGHKASTVRVIGDLPEPTAQKNLDAVLGLLTKTRSAPLDPR